VLRGACSFCWGCCADCGKRGGDCDEGLLIPFHGLYISLVAASVAAVSAVLPVGLCWTIKMPTVGEAPTEATATDESPAVSAHMRPTGAYRRAMYAPPAGDQALRYGVRKKP
jgi:hypothetical protein